MFCPFSHIAPTGYPRIVRVVSVGKKYIALDLEEVDCFEQNGFITGYSVIYKSTQIRPSKLNYRYEANSPSTKITLGPLDPGTMYTITAAARNVEGVGPYSPKIRVQTRTLGECMLNFCACRSISHTLKRFDTGRKLYLLCQCHWITSHCKNMSICRM